MKPKWLIQTNIDGIDTRPMIDEVDAQGMIVSQRKHITGNNIDFTRYGPTDCVICYGDIDFVRQVIKRSPFIPGAWCNYRNMKCSIYYTYFGEHLLNQQYAMMPLGDMLRQWDQWIAYAPDQSWFIRPDSGAKPFTGYVLTPDDKHKIQTLVQAVGPETLIIVAPEKQISAEWRFVICDRKVVAGCRYLPDECSTYPPSSFCLAELIASQEWQPDLCYTVDIAESEGEMYLLEINSFSCAGFYGCNITAIVRNASIAAENEWLDYCDPGER